MRLSILFVLIFFAIAGCVREDRDESDGLAAGDTAHASLDVTGDFQGPLGLQLYSIRHAMEEDVAGTLDWVRGQGFGEVETHSTYGMTPQQFRQELDRAGIRATAMHAGYERFRDGLESVLDEAEALGVDYVGIAWIPHPEDRPFGVDRARQAASDFNRWGEAAAERGLTFFYHPHGYEFEPATDGSVPFDVLVDETNPEHVAFEMDVFWVAHPGADPVRLLREHPGRWSLMHIKDMKAGTKGDYSGHAPAEANVPVGTGGIDYANVLKAASEIGVRRYYIEDESTDPMANIPKSVAYLEQVEFP